MDTMRRIGRRVTYLGLWRVLWCKSNLATTNLIDFAPTLPAISYTKIRNQNLPKNLLTYKIWHANECKISRYKKNVIGSNMIYSSKPNLLYNINEMYRSNKLSFITTFNVDMRRKIHVYIIKIRGVRHIYNLQWDDADLVEYLSS